MKKTFLILAILAPMFMWAQTEGDMLDFSTVNYQGTAKSAAMGNAMGAVGSDFSAIAINPAGLGLFRKATFTFTPEFSVNSTESNYKDNSGFDRAFKLQNNNIGLTWTQNFNDESLTSVSCAIGVNKLNNYKSNIYVNGNNPHTSLIDAYIDELYENGIDNDLLLEDYSPNNIFPLWNTYLLDFYADGSIGSVVPQGGLRQEFGANKNGYMREFTFATGFNFNDKFFLGVALDVPYFSKNTTYDYKETNLDVNDDFRHWSQTEYLKNSGVGVNAKIGAIIYPARWLRLGASFHTPSIYNVTESWYTDTKGVFSSGSYYHESETSTYDYIVTTPYRANASIALIFGNFGMITGDWEYVDYRTMHASSRDYNFNNFNNHLHDLYKESSNIRIGTEWRWQTLAFRAGYSINGSPFGFDKEDLKTTSYSCGLGFTHHRFTLDLAYVLSKRNNTYDLYSNYSLYPAYYTENNVFVADETKVKETTNINRVIISFKFRLD